MAIILKGKPVSDAILERTRNDAQQLRSKGIIPTLAVLRAGEKENDLAYERGAKKRCESAGVDIRICTLDENVDAETFYKQLDELNHDDAVHGILMMRPLPKQIDEETARKMLLPENDVDGCTDGSLAGVFTDSNTGFAPCTAQAAMEIMDYYDIDLKGKMVTIIGRSLVIGRPLAMMMMHRQATPTICHHFTPELEKVTKNADIVVTSAGHAEIFGENYFSAAQTVIDVGITWSEEKGKLCGDVKFDEAEPIVQAITPVPGGIGAVTTSVLVSHVVEAAKRRLTRYVTNQADRISGQ